MTDQPTAETVETAPVAQPAAPVIPGNPVQTEKAVEFFRKNEAALDYVVRQVKGSEPAPAPAQSGVSPAEFEALKMALKYQIPEDKLALIQDTTPEGVRQRAEQLAAILPKPAPAAPVAEVQAPTETPKSAGVPLPVAAVLNEVPKTREAINDYLVAKFAAEPLPK